MRNTKQRDEVLRIVLASCDHPTAESVYLRVKECMPSVSLGTVYRNLCLLAGHDLIRQIHVADAADRYDKTLSDHSHFRCGVCGTVFDLDCPADLPPTAHSAADALGHKIEKTEIVFYGVCKNCRNNITEKEK